MCEIPSQGSFLADFKFTIGQRVRVKEGSFQLFVEDGYHVIGQVGSVVRSWNPRNGTNAMYTARSENIQYFEVNHYDVRIGERVYMLNEDWLEEE